MASSGAVGVEVGEDCDPLLTPVDVERCSPESPASSVAPPPLLHSSVRAVGESAKMPPPPSPPAVVSASTPSTMSGLSFDWTLPDFQLEQGMQVSVDGTQFAEFAAYHGRTGTLVRLVPHFSGKREKGGKEKIFFVEVRLDVTNQSTNAYGEQEEKRVRLPLDSIRLILEDGSQVADWSGEFVGLDSVYKRVLILDRGDRRYGIAMSPVRRAFSPEHKAGRGERIKVYLDIGVTVERPAKQIQWLSTLNKRCWFVVNPFMHAYTPKGPCNPEGSYPVYLSSHCLSEQYGKFLEQELRFLENHVDFDHYHDSEGNGNWKPNDGHGSREKTLVRVLYGYDCEEGRLPCQNPCGGVQWSSEEFSPPYIRMPPATRKLSKLLRAGNPELAAAFGKHANLLYGCAAMTLYRHSNRVGSALDWHMDKSLGIETACVSVAVNNMGFKTIGISAGATGEAPYTFQCPPNSCWWANAKAVSHAVGNDDYESATIIFRTLIPHSLYPWFFPSGAKEISARLHSVKRRFFPVLTNDDVAAVLRKDKHYYLSRKSQYTPSVSLTCDIDCKDADSQKDDGYETPAFVRHASSPMKDERGQSHNSDARPATKSGDRGSRVISSFKAEAGGVPMGNGKISPFREGNTATHVPGSYTQCTVDINQPRIKTDKNSPPSQHSVSTTSRHVNNGLIPSFAGVQREKTD
eukprot:CAMPEP_0114501756 /NCGR_PEP_ID=MMETSP0109-20121206/8670_1 /TAXON_ID=29199 /ORGANISM="Chlorarachnion reptans, Strain CCCM449" /LENGTH=688 /DNA_ID=CAMNT_0001679511 /DNA_START=263 /DNA_END=2329 /DNA_ORIENTATION=-